MEYEKVSIHLIVMYKPNPQLLLTMSKRTILIVFTLLQIIWIMRTELLFVFIWMVQLFNQVDTFITFTHNVIIIIIIIFYIIIINIIIIFFFIIFIYIFIIYYIGIFIIIILFFFIFFAIITIA